MASDWIEQYTKWATKRSPLTPVHFHQNIALTTLAGAVAGRCFIQLPHETIYPNLYTLMIARTSVFAKTTAMNLGRRMAREVMPDKIFSSIGSPEALFDHLAGEMPMNYKDLDESEKKNLQAAKKWGARRLFVLDEAGLFFNTLTKDYGSSMADHFMALYDAGSDPIEHTTRSRGLITIKNYAMSVLFATTPYSVKNLLTQRQLWMNGFWARWNFVSANELTEWREGQYVDCPIEVISTLRKINDGWLLQHNDKPYSIAIEAGVLKEYMRSTESIRSEIIKTEDERFDGLVSRLTTKHLKAAMLYSIIDNPNIKPTHVKMRHWEQAAPLVNGWFVEAQQALELSHQSERVSEEEKVIGYVRNFSNEGVSNRRLQQLSHLTASELAKITEPLAKAGTIFQKKEGRVIFWAMTEEKEKSKVSTKL